MKLKKASTSSIYYPTKKHIRPIVLSISVAMALSSCGTQPEIEVPLTIGGGMIGAPVIEQNTTTLPKPFLKEKKINPPISKEAKVVEPEILGGVMPLPDDLHT